MKKLSIISLAAAALIGCSTADRESDLALDNEVQITSSISTRASDQTWATNDKIGVYMSTTGGTELGDLGKNTLYTTADGDGVFSTTTPLYYPFANRVDFMAYYPHSDAAGFDPTAYSVNVESQTDLPAIDLMIATKSGVASNGSAVDLTFAHKLSYIDVAITVAQDLGSVSSITLRGTTSEASYDLTKGDGDSPITPSSESEDIEMSLTSDGAKAEAIVIPQTLSGAEFVVKIGDVESIVPITTSAFTIGDKFSYTLTVNDTSVEFSAARISAWVSGGAVEELEAEPVVVEVTAANYSELGVNEDAVGCWILYADRSSADAADITETSILNNDEDTFYADTNTESSDLNKIYKKLLLASADLSSGSDWEGYCTAAKTYDVGGYSDWRLPTIKELELIYAESGQEIFSSDKYWSATTNSSSTSNAWYVTFRYGVTSNLYKTYVYYYARPVKEL